MLIVLIGKGVNGFRKTGTVFKQLDYKDYHTHIEIDKSRETRIISGFPGHAFETEKCRTKSK